MTELNTVTTRIAAREYARLHSPDSEDGQKPFYNEGLRLFSNMEMFDIDYRRASLDTFAMKYLVPMVINYYKHFHEARHE